MTVAKETSSDHCASLAKGLGRALQDTRAAGCLIDEDAVLDACLNARSYDPPLEDARAPWLIEILTAGAALDRFREPIVAALADPTDDWSCAQLCDFAEFYARHGDAPSRKALYRTFDQMPFPTTSRLADEQIIRLDGLTGFLRLSERRGAQARSNLEPWHVLGPVGSAEEIFGADAVVSALEEAAARSPNQRAFLEVLQAERRAAKSSGRQSTADRSRAASLEEVLAYIAEGPSSGRALDLAGWGRQAPSGSLQAVAAGLFQKSDPSQLKRYLMVFQRTPLPDFDDRLTDLTGHADEAVRARAMQALAANKLPAVRALALERLREGRVDGGTIALLKHNYELGDHRLIESVLAETGDRDAMHDLCWGLEQVFAENKTPGCANSLLFAYEATPCSLCREKYVAILLEFDKAPAPLREECAFDANLETRELIKGSG